MNSDNSIGRSGFTLIEFCVAILIMMVGLLGLLQVVNVATDNNLGNMLRNEAVTIADNQMVMAKTSVVDTATFTALVSTAAPILVSTPVRSGSKSYSVTRTVTSVSTNSKEIVVTVSWQHKEKPFQYMISSLAVNPGS
ncbi:MAG: prepilin-type cleavage/methylation domain-containing protein [Desulfuromonadaceae bacterium]|nr:prepilin-type cleavage/methylation domain-containing protein [Desulfuromonadaceae bacterium]